MEDRVNGYHVKNGVELTFGSRVEVLDDEELLQ